jgi:hypothetical protein
MSSINNLSIQQLRQAADLKEKIAGLEKQLSAVLGSAPKAAAAPTPAPKKKGGMSAAGKARIVAAQKARWAKIKAAKAVKPVVKAAAPAAKVAKPAKKKFVMSAAAKAKISAAAKARWAKIKAAKK